VLLLKRMPYGIAERPRAPFPSGTRLAYRPRRTEIVHGVAHARAQLGVAYDMIERQFARTPWAAGDEFSMEAQPYLASFPES